MITIEQKSPLRWMVAKTMARAEKQVAEYCTRKGILAYLPLRRSVRRYPHRIKTFMVPMFPGYVFFQLDPIDKLLVQECRHTAMIIVPDDSMEELLVQELNDLQICEQATAEGEVDVRPEIAEGKIVEIRTGPFMGMHGIVNRRKGHTRLTVNIELIGQSVTIELDVGEVEVEF